MSDLNLIPYELKQKRAKTFQLRQYISFGIIIAAVFIIVILLPSIYVSILTVQESDISSKIAANSSVIVENKKTLADIQNYKAFNDKVDLLTKNKVKVSDEINNIAKYKPAEVSIINISLVKGSITINGSATSVNSVSVFVASLQASKDYSNAKLVSVSDTSSKDKSTTVSKQFSISIQNSSK